MNNTKIKKTNKELLDFIKHSPSPYHAVEYGCTLLKNANFTELNINEAWNLEPNSAYFINQYGTTLIAFTTGNEINSSTAIRMANAHTDQPCFRVKPNPVLLEKKYLKLNIETYGGAIINTWLDRPLSMAGKIVLKSDNVFTPNTMLVDFKKPILTIPNLAIHLNREVNKGIELNKQTDILPIIGMMEDSLNKENFFEELLASSFNINIEDIVDFDLYIYALEEGCTIGVNDDFISAPRLDNLTSSLSLIKGIMASNDHNEDNNNSNINIIGLFDNEEIGSRTKQGADSMLSNIVISKIFDGLGKSQIDVYNAIPNSFCLSMDVSHAFHPNYSAKNDPTNIVLLNEGIVLKIDTTQRYATDIEALATLEQLCAKYDIKFQKYVNRSDAIGGSTLGSISSSWMPMKTVDLGVPMLAMHSARELMGSKDQYYLNQLSIHFFTEAV
ncbi:MAG: M18 family aminopeptidase [Lachnospiraceae bacterium]|nr:M18 family aminopeptidase [Lachnospiraceae bacterium]